MKRKVYGELSIRDYQRVLDSVKRREERLGHGTPANGPERAEASVPYPTSRPQRWKRLTRVMRAAVVVILVLSTYAAGAAWQWDGKWSRMLTVDQAVLVLQDPASMEDKVHNALGRLRVLLRKGINELAVVANQEDPSGEHAAGYLKNTLDQVQQLHAQLRRR